MKPCIKGLDIIIQFETNTCNQYLRNMLAISGYFRQLLCTFVSTTRMMHIMSVAAHNSYLSNLLHHELLLGEVYPKFRQFWLQDHF